jgi:hypothetical protein
MLATLCHLILFVGEESGKRHAITVMKRVDLAASTKFELVTQSFFSLMNRRTLAFVTDAIRSHGPLPDYGSAKSIRRTKMPVSL